jgi:hypothetical protein
MPNYLSYYFNILFRASFNKIVATLYFSSNLLFLKNVENCRVIVDKQPKQVGRLQMPEMRSNCFGFLSSKMKFTSECIKRNVLCETNYTHTNLFIMAIIKTKKYISFFICKKCVLLSVNSFSMK